MILSTDTLAHYSWGDSCSGWRLIHNSRLSVIQELMPPGTAEELHYHRHSQQLFYILAGEAFFEINGQHHIVRARQAIHVPSGSRHFIANKTKLKLEFLVISEPASNADRCLVRNLTPTADA